MACAVEKGDQTKKTDAKASSSLFSRTGYRVTLVLCSVNNIDYT